MRDTIQLDTTTEILAIKIAKLRALSTLLTSLDKLRVVSGALGVVGADHDAHEIFKLIDRIETAGLRMDIPDIM